jgi:hypothetical protein
VYLGIIIVTGIIAISAWCQPILGMMAHNVTGAIVCYL